MLSLNENNLNNKKLEQHLETIIESKIEEKNAKETNSGIEHILINEDNNGINNNQKRFVNVIVDDDLEGKMPSKKSSFRDSIKTNVEVFFLKFKFMFAYF